MTAPTNIVSMDGQAVPDAEQVLREARVQLRLPLRSLEELDLHLHTIAMAIENCQAIVRRARRTRDAEAALMMCRYRLRTVDKMLNILPSRSRKSANSNQSKK